MSQDNSNPMKKRAPDTNITATNTEDDHHHPPNKKFKSAIEDDLICAISLQLPYDPVTAEDGRIYERSAIEDYIKSREGRELKSPITQEKIGEKLFPSPQMKSHIETLINRGDIVGDLAKNWKEKDQQKKYNDDFIKGAENGDPKSMMEVGFHYRFGRSGFPKDAKKAYKWFEKSHSAGHIPGTCFFALMLLRKGRSVEKNVPLGIMHLSIAAYGGVDLAAQFLGMALAEGKYGLGIQKSDAIKWLKIALSGECKFKNLSEVGKERAEKKLQELHSSGL